MSLDTEHIGTKIKSELPEVEMGNLYVKCTVIVHGEKRKAVYYPCFGWMTEHFAPLTDIEEWEYDL